MADLFKKLTFENGVTVEQPLGLFINNEWVSTDKTIATVNPTTGEVIAEVFAASPSHVDDAVAAARAAFESDEWSAISAAERGDYLYKIYEIMKRDSEIFASIECTDNGKPWGECLEGDLAEACDVFKYFAGFADKITGKTIEPMPGKLGYMRPEPLGVCGQIIPWNFPIMMFSWKVAPALSCGNTVVIKSSEITPLTALYFGKVVLEAGIPKGVVNILSGLGADCGSALASHKDVDKVAFTGSTATGQRIMEAAAKSNLKNVTLECGGKSPYIVFEDCDLEQAVKWAYIGIFYNKGEVCTSCSRIYVQDSIYDKFLEAFAKHCEETIKISSPFAEGCTIGPLVSDLQYSKVKSYVEIGKKEGARLVYGGDFHEGPGYFMTPTIFADCTQEMRVNREEIFGPVVAVSKFSTVEEAIAKANDTEYGLAAAIFSDNITKCHRVANKLQAGMVWINSNGDSHIGIPFGGVKASGIGRELGPYALDMYTSTKAIHINIGEPI